MPANTLNSITSSKSWSEKHVGKSQQQAEYKLEFLQTPRHRSAAGTGRVICTGTAVLKPKNNPQSVVHHQQSALNAAEPARLGGTCQMLFNRFTHKESEGLSSGRKQGRSKSRRSAAVQHIHRSLGQSEASPAPLTGERESL